MYTNANLNKESKNGGYFGSHHLILQKYYKNMIFLLQNYKKNENMISYIAKIKKIIYN